MTSHRPSADDIELSLNKSLSQGQCHSARAIKRGRADADNRLQTGGTLFSFHLLAGRILLVQCMTCHVTFVGEYRMLLVLPGGDIPRGLKRDLHNSSCSELDCAVFLCGND
jgi:hypothetical protein